MRAVPSEADQAGQAEIEFSQIICLAGPGLEDLICLPYQSL